jgi:outer membrane biogenesis lipoprotein LolB
MNHRPPPTAYTVLAAACLLLAGCAAPLAHGTITGKHYEPAEQHTQMEPIYGDRCTTSGKRTSCSTTITGWFPQSTTTPECYRLDLRDGQQTGHVCVSPDEYAHARTGGKW